MAYHVADQDKRIYFSHYTHLSKLHILPFLGEIPIEHLTTKIVEDHILMLLSSGRIDGTGGLSPKTVSDILAIIKGSIAYAKNSGKQVTCYLEQITIRKSQVDMRVLNREEEERLHSTLLFDTDFSKLGVLLCLYTGIRIGEVCALKWGNFNFEAGTLSIYETLQRIQNVDDGSKHKTKIVVTTPKSQNSVRIIPLPDSLINILSRFKSSPRAYILTGCDDKFMEPRVLQYKFKKYAIESGVRNINYHALRHKIEVRDYERISAELQPIEETIYDLQEKMNNLIQQAEKTKEKLTKAINDGNQFWISLYSRQLALHMGAQEELFSLFIEIEKQRGWYENIISQLKDCKDDFCQAESHDKQDQNTAFIRYDLSMDYTPLLKLAEDVARMRESLKTNEYKLYEVMKSIEEADQAQAEELKLLEEQINANGASLLFSEDRM